MSLFPKPKKPLKLNSSQHRIKKGDTEMKFYQACYGKPDNTNFSAFNVSPDLPPSLYEEYELVGGGYNPANLLNNDLFEADGKSKDLTLFEIVSQHGRIYFSRVSYSPNIVDIRKRRSMFAHTFIFPDNNVLIDDVAELLSVSEDNFRFSPDETKDIPKLLITDITLTPSNFLSSVGISMEIFSTLMSGIHLLLASKTNYPIYVISNLDNKKIRTLIYGILISLPYELREALSFANTFNNARSNNKLIIFSNVPVTNAYFVNLTNGSTNIDFSDIKAHPDRYPFICNVDISSPVSADTYFRSLNKIARNIPHNTNNVYNILKIADMMLAGSTVYARSSYEETTKSLLQFIGSAPLGNPEIDKFLTEVLEVYYNKLVQGNKPVSDSIINNLSNRVQKTSISELNSIFDKIMSYVLTLGGKEKVLEFLSRKYSAQAPDFTKWRDSIMNLKNGESYVLAFYSNLIAKSTSLAEVDNLYLSVPPECLTVDFRNSLANGVIKMAKDSITRVANIAPNTGSCKFLEVFEDYKKCIADITEKKDMSYYTPVLIAFWNAYDFSGFSFERSYLAPFQKVFDLSFLDNADFSKNIDVFSNILKIENEATHFSANGKETFRRILLILEKTERLNINPKVINTVRPKVFDMLMKNLERKTNSMLFFWFKVASFGENVGITASPLTLMIEKRLPVITDKNLVWEELSAGISAGNGSFDTICNAISKEEPNFAAKTEERRIFDGVKSVVADLSKERARQRKKEVRDEFKQKRAENKKLRKGGGF